MQYSLASILLLLTKALLKKGFAKQSSILLWVPFPSTSTEGRLKKCIVSRSILCLGWVGGGRGMTQGSQLSNDHEELCLNLSFSRRSVLMLNLFVLPKSNTVILKNKGKIINDKCVRWSYRPTRFSPCVFNLKKHCIENEEI